jgi:DNA segregation ATPase FtsK/SpoIIIE-like protein
MASSSEHAPLLPGSLRARLEACLMGLLGWALLALCVAAAASLLTWSAADPSLTRTASGVTRNALGAVGANFADLAMRLFGLAAVFILLPPVFWGLQLMTRRQLEDARLQLMLALPAVLLLASAASALPGLGGWPLPYGLGGFLGDQTLKFTGSLLGAASPEHGTLAAAMLCTGGGAMLLVASLGMSVRDVGLLCQIGRPRFDLIARAGRWLAGGGERADPAYDRREPVFDASPEPRRERRQPSFSVEPAFELDPPIRRTGDRVPQPSGKSVHLRRPVVGDPEFDRATDAASQAMARRFAPPPAREEPSGPAGLGLFRRRWLQPGREVGQDWGPDWGRTGERAPATGERRPERRPVWPGSVPVPVEEEAAAEPYPRGEGDELYGRAVALVRAHRKVSATDLQRSLGIRYMRAADLIDRMEREGIIGAPVQGSRPILGVHQRSRIV